MINAENLPHASGIYKIENLITHHVYIGQSKDIYRRYHFHHKYDYKKLDFQLYKAMRKYGIENFSIVVLELCEESKLDEREVFWISYYDSYHNGYNATSGGKSSFPEITNTLEMRMQKKETLEKNKSLQGENHPRAKLTDKEVINIRTRYKNGESVKQIYKDYQNIYSNINSFRCVVLGTSYSKVNEKLEKADIRYSNAKLTSDQVREIRKRYLTEKTSYAKLAKEYHVSASTIGNIVMKKAYKNIE